MLEIILLIFICKGIGKVLRKKGRNPLALQIATVVFWFGGEFCGAIVGGIVLAIQNQAFDGFNLTVYLCAIGGAALGVGVVFAIAHLIPPTADHQAVAYAEVAAHAYDPSAPPSANPYNPYDRGN